jgi:hypothetical protein
MKKIIFLFFFGIALSFSFRSLAYDGDLKGTKIYTFIKAPDRNSCVSEWESTPYGFMPRGIHNLHDSYWVGPSELDPYDKEGWSCKDLLEIYNSGKDSFVYSEELARVQRESRHLLKEKNGQLESAQKKLKRLTIIMLITDVIALISIIWLKYRKKDDD